MVASDRRYQVFISSTFTDLVEERQIVLKAILEIDYMPAGMELFPATDDAAWQLIKDVIDSSDYYVLVVGGRYGSMDTEGLSYTEKEYDYSVKQKKPVVAFLHKLPETLPREKTETDKDAWDKLIAFRKKVEANHTCVYWESAEDLKAKVIVGLTATAKRNPAVGWVRADQVPSGATLNDILKLRNRVAELEGELEKARTSPPSGTDDLLQGEETYELHLTFTARKHGDSYLSEKSYRATINPSWNDIFAGIAPTLINEASDVALRNAFRDSMSRVARAEFGSYEQFEDHALSGFAFQNHELDTCLVQLRALGLIKESDRKRSVKDTATYWRLTPYGDQLMVQLLALRRSKGEKQRVAGSATPAEEDDS